MPKRSWARAALVLACLAAAGCSGSPVGKDGFSQEEINMVSHKTAEPEKDGGPTAPGMIPADCEALLNNSQAWGYHPGQKWKPAAPEQAMEAVKFFGGFKLVPLTTSDAYRAFENGGSLPVAEAQVCDPFLAQTFLDGLLAYPWGKAERLEAGKQFHRFLLNQQSLFLPLLHRALEGRVFTEATRLGLVPGSHAKAKAFKAWMEKELAALPQVSADEASPAEQLQAQRRQAALSAKIRDKLGTLIPLP